MTRRRFTGKRCFKCGLSKSPEEFYRHPQMADGRLGKCKDCTKKDVAANYYADPDRREVRRVRDDRYRRIYPERVKANKAVGNAVRDGRLKRLPCEVCSSPKSEAHHDDYSKPLDVRWLCKQHHEAHHHEAS